MAGGPELYARLEMAVELHTAIYGDTWTRPESPRQVWAQLLAKVEADQARIAALELALVERGIPLP